MRTKEFREAIYELAFGDNAINRGFSEEEVIATIKGFAHDSWVAAEAQAAFERMTAYEEHSQYQQQPMTEEELIAKLNAEREG